MVLMVGPHRYSIGRKRVLEVDRVADVAAESQVPVASRLDIERSVAEPLVELDTVEDPISATEAEAGVGLARTAEIEPGLDLLFKQVSVLLFGTLSYLRKQVFIKLCLYRFVRLYLSIPFQRHFKSTRNLSAIICR